MKPLLVLLILPSLVLAQDMPLSLILLPKEDWQELADFPGKPGVLASDGERLAVADAEKPILRLLDREGKHLFTLPTSAVVGGMWKTKNKLYASLPSRKKIIHLGVHGEEKPAYEEVHARELALVGKHLYYLDPDQNAVFLAGRKDPVAKDLVGASGIIGWADGSTLVVGEARGKHLVTFRVDTDGTLDARERYYPLRVRPKQSSEVRQLALDAGGRLYAATREGVQVFDPTGRLCGVLSRPVRAAVTGIALVGDRLFILCDGKLWWRKLKVSAVSAS